MALNEQEATAFVEELLVAFANSGSLKILGPTTGITGGAEQTNLKRGEYDAKYLSSLFRVLVAELQK
ncbi:MAG: hypothetical protein ACTJHW_11655 [Paenalcaligenes sp.]